MRIALLCMTALAAQCSGQNELSDVLARFERAYRETGTLRVTLREAEGFISSHPSVEPSDTGTGEGGSIYDDRTGRTLPFLWESEIILDPLGRRFFIRKRSIDGRLMHPEGGFALLSSYSPTAYWQAASASSLPANVSFAPDGSEEGVSTLVEALERGRSTGFMQGAIGEYYVALILALAYLRGVDDVQLRDLDASGAVWLESRVLGLRCLIGRESGELLGVVVRTPQGVEHRMEVVDFFEGPCFPARAPAIVRREVARTSGGGSVKIAAYDSSPEALLVADSMFDWSTYRARAIDERNNVVLHRDGTEEGWIDGRRQFREALERGGMDLSDRRERGHGDPVLSKSEVLDPSSPMISHLRGINPGAWLIGCGILLTGVAVALIIWKRSRT